MALEPGNNMYDNWATRIREAEMAQVVLVCVLGGLQGSGWSIQGPREAQIIIPDLLEEMAQAMRART